MNFKDFSLLSEDEENYTIGHPQGKSMTVSKKGLNEKAHALIRKLKPKESQDHYEAGGQVSSRRVNTPEQIENELTANAENKQNPPQMDMSQGEDRGNLLTGDPSISVPLPPGYEKTAESGADLVEAYEHAKSALGKFGSALGQGVKGQAFVPEVSAGETPIEAKAIDQAEQTQSVPPDQINSNNAPMAATQDNIPNPNARLPDLADSDKELNSALGKINGLKSANQYAQEYANQDALFQKRLDENKLDPNRVFSNQGAGSKIANAIALIIGGFGSGITGGPNLAMEAIKRTVDLDIDAQKNEREGIFNAWKLNRDKYRDDVQANLATQNQALAAVKAIVSKAEVRSLNAQASQRLQELKNSMNNQMAMNNFMRGQLSGGSPGTEEDYLKNLALAGQMNPAVADKMEKKYIPGKGVYRKPVTEKEFDQINAIDNFKKLAQHAEHFAKTVGTTVPGSERDAEAENIRVGLYESIPKIRGMDASTDAKLDLFSKLFSSPGAFRTGKFLTQLREVYHDTVAREKTLNDNLGFMPFKKQPNTEDARAWANQNINSKDPNTKNKAMRIMQSLGGK